MIVFDSSPLIHLTQLGKLNYVIDIFKEITIPHAVYEEVVIKGVQMNQNDAKIIQSYIEEKKIVVQDVEIQGIFKDILHPGEREAIFLSKKENALLIIDEKKGRIIARQHNITVHGTLGMLLILLEEKIIDISYYLENLRLYADNGWISLKLYEKFRNEVKYYE
jgi:predicted nucleic acid-binding protein